MQKRALSELWIGEMCMLASADTKNPKALEHS